MAVFNREDGQLALGSKTPVSILQEILQKKGMSPHYELIYNGVGTPDPRFKFRVTAEGVTAIGDGKSKKEAKHDAAATLLKRLLTNKEEMETELKEEVDIASPYTGALKTNFVGMLDEITFTNKIPTANYVLVLEEGPPHARVFTMRCDLSSISEIAVARTKKQAKHLVAQKMIDRVQKILKDKFIPPLESDEAMEEIISDQEKIRNGSFHHDLTHKVRQVHNVFHDQKDEQPLPPIFQKLHEKPEEFYESMEKPLEFLEEVVEALEGVLKTNYITREEFEASLKKLVDLFECDWCGDYEDDSKRKEPSVTNGVDIGEKQDKPDAMNRVDIDNILPDYPLSEEEEDEKTENTVVDSVEEVKVTRDVEDFDVVYSFVNVEVPRGLWEFVGRGRSDREALERAARRALKFLRLMAVPPPENSS